MTLTLLHVVLLWGQVVGQVGATAFQLPPFLQKLSQREAGGEGERVFTLPSHVLNVPNIRRFTPRKKHLKPHKLMRRLRKDWDPFWMSAERPQDMDGTVVKQAPPDPSLVKAVDRLNFTLLGPDGLHRVIDDSVAHVLGAWLLQRSTCHVHYVWDDLGVLFWPRWVRRGYCQAGASPSSSSSSSSSSPFHDASSSSPDLSESCSWPPGMHCVPAESRRIRILRWQCRHNKAFNNWNPRFRKARGKRPKVPGGGEKGEGRGAKREKREVSAPRNQTGEEESNETENWSRQPFKERRKKLSMRCKWKKTPYPVTDDCYCS
ncbi:uncharacterized protein LOC143292999 [Babylonia areolata]|uniref:uncharacterized protein LOC143292999 n=1 Tax=Babylonia areolata TaxID=304850 RepID=UPI003FD66F26